MKKIIIISLFLSTFNLFCQDSEPSAYEIEWGSLPTNRPLEVDSFNVDRFKLGFQWSGSPQMSNALYHNIVHGGNPGDVSDNFTEEMFVISQPHVKGIKNMAMIQYEPTLQVENYRDFVTRYNDPTNAIFGFGNIKGRILDTSLSGSVNYNRLILEQDSSYPANKVVLSDITPNDQFFTINGGGQISDYDGEN